MSDVRCVKLAQLLQSKFFFSFPQNTTFCDSAGVKVLKYGSNALMSCSFLSVSGISVLANKQVPS